MKTRKNWQAVDSKAVLVRDKVNPGGVQEDFSSVEVVLNLVVVEVAANNLGAAGKDRTAEVVSN